MHAIRIVTLTDESGTYRVILPEGAKVQGIVVRIDPGAEYRDFADEDGLIEMTGEAILQFARDGIDGFSLVEEASVARHDVEH